jgi:hypothetical protein
VKLLTKTNIYSSITTILLFAIGIFIVYEVIFAKLDKEADNQLLTTKAQIIKRLKDGISPKEFMSNIGQKIYVRKIAKQTIFDNKFIEYTGKKTQEEITGVDLNDSRVMQRELLFQTTIDSQAYEATVCISLAEGKK